MNMQAPQGIKDLSAIPSFMTGAEMVSAVLKEQGVSVVFGYPGGSVLSLFDTLDQSTSLSIIQPGHEQAGVHAAAGYAQASGKTAVVIGTSGPGATNMITGIYDMDMDSIPAVIITGQVSRAVQGTKAFQECDIVTMAAPCTKATFAIQSASELSATLHEAFALARSGRPGPVLVDIPRDVQDEIGFYTNLESIRATQNSTLAQAPAHAFAFLRKKHANRDTAFVNKETTRIDIAPETAFHRTAKLMNAAKEPVILLGGGAQNAAEAARALVAKTGFPVVSTFKGLGIIPSDDPHMLGMGGMHGTYEANKALFNADFILCVGGRFDDRLTGPVNGFAPSAKIVHVNIDPESIGKNVHTNIGIVADSQSAIQEITKRLAPDPAQTKKWNARIKKWKARKCLAFYQGDKVIKPQSIIRALSAKVADADPIITTDVGQHQMWTAQHYAFTQPHRFFSSGGAGTMGSGIPAAIGAQIACPEKPVYFITGDGSIQMHIQELGTAAANNLPIKGIVLDNGYLGMVRQQQQVGFQKRYAQTKRKRPDLLLIAEGYGFSAFELDRPSEIGSTMDAFLACEGPALLICRVSEKENCFPMIIPGKPHNQMLMRQRLIPG